jgi:hypothetical protein
MHRSSDAIGNISAALAKAQVELTNPEESLVATIRSPFPREADRTFRYTPLSSGLHIIRKSLGRHEIATIQSTGIDKEAGLLRLTTILAHSSGEWISSEWPVCPISDTASAQRMGGLPSPMRDGMRFSRWWALLENLISTRRILRPPPIPRRRCRDHRILARKRMGNPPHNRQRHRFVLDRSLGYPSPLKNILSRNLMSSAQRASLNPPIWPRLTFGWPFWRRSQM